MSRVSGRGRLDEGTSGDFVDALGNNIAKMREQDIEELIAPDP